MKRLIIALLLLAAVIATAAGAQDEMCLQDQYGHQWNFTIDHEHKYLYGTVTMVAVDTCADPVWPVLGSFSHRPALKIELTAVNPSPDIFSCSTSKVKGVYPDFAWYYEEGYGAQEATWAECGTPVEPAGDLTGGFQRIPE